MTNEIITKPDLSIAKIVATPTPLAWSQAYNAGNLFAVLSLVKEESDEENLLNISGKEILNSLETEYYSLETKDLESVKNAFLTASEKIPANCKACFLVGAITDNILYLFSRGTGKAILKRRNKTGVLISSKEQEGIISASGFLENNDIFILETLQFEDIIPQAELLSSLDNATPSEIAEALSPKIHEKEGGGAASIIILYNKLQIAEDGSEEEREISSKIEDAPKKETIELPPPSLPINLMFIKKYLKLPEISFSKKIFLTISALLIIILVSGILFTIRKQENNKSKAVFQEVFPEAQKKFDEGTTLLSLNKNLARDDFLAAQKILNENKSKFKTGTDEEKRISDLLKKVEESLGASLNANFIQPKTAESGQSNILDYEFKNSSFNFYAKDGNKIFSIDANSINSSDKKEIIKNKDYWTDLGGFGTYLGNFYVLDKKSNQILKFVPSGETFEKTDYFASGQSPDISKTQAIAIDGSIWILDSNGSVMKFTKGKQESFKLSGLDKPLVNPTRIFTDKDSDKLYILDNGNSRIVILSKEGAYQSQYQAKILKPAKDFEVLEKDKKIYILSENKIWEIEIK